MSQAEPGFSARENTEILAQVVHALGGSRRAGQVTMVEEVTRAITDGHHLLIQAGTGTGKSLGYLIPALALAARENKRTIISTATLALQRQITTCDAPLATPAITRATGAIPQVAVLKGWQNYACRFKLAGGFPDDGPSLFTGDSAAVAATIVARSDTQSDLTYDDAAAPASPAALFGDSPASAPSAPSAPSPEPEANEATDTSGQPHPIPVRPDEPLSEQVRRVIEWANDSPTGDRDDLIPGVSDKAWRNVSVNRRECLGQVACPFAEDCFAFAARDTAGESDVIVTNHALVGLATEPNGAPLPEHDVLIVDEAHELRSRVTTARTRELTETALRALITHAKKLSLNHDILDGAVEEFSGTWQAIPTGLIRPGRMALGAQENLATLDRATREVFDELIAVSDNDQGAKALARAAYIEVMDTIAMLRSQRAEAGQVVIWCDRGRDGDMPTRVMAAPLDVAAPIAHTLLADHTAIFTSATLAIGGSFDVAAANVGLTVAENTYEAIDVGTPFTPRTQGVLYVARHLAKPGREGPREDMLVELTELIEAAGGGCLGLFSSRRAAEEAAEWVRAHCDLPILAQGEGQLPQLTEQFRAEDATSLFGTLSLWQGVDVPGRTCRLVTIDRIPFPRPDDPLTMARTQAVAKAGGNGFMAVSAASAGLLLAQGAGRLLRRADDRGVVAVLDPRLASAGYGGFLTRCMPDFWRTTDKNQVREILSRLSRPS